ncbi:30118_t:CDS:2, partial [Gigaspora margarita]
EVNNESNNETNDETIIDNENNMVDNEKDNNDEANNLANSFHEEAAQLAVECNNNEMAQCLKTFIDQKKHFLTNNQKDDKSTNKSDYSEEEDNSSIINLLVTKQYKSALEKARHQPYSCCTCGQIGHNSVQCENSS